MIYLLFMATSASARTPALGRLLAPLLAGYDDCFVGAMGKVVVFLVSFYLIL